MHGWKSDLLRRAIAADFITLPVAHSEMLAPLRRADCGIPAALRTMSRARRSVLRAAQPIGDLIRDPAGNPVLHRQLREVQAIREFASRDLPRFCRRVASLADLDKEARYQALAALHRVGARAPTRLCKGWRPRRLLKPSPPPSEKLETPSRQRRLSREFELRTSPSSSFDSLPDCKPTGTGATHE